MHDYPKVSSAELSKLSPTQYTFLKKNVFFLFEVSHAAKLQAEMTKTKTQAELHCSRELQWAWLVHSASELRNRLLTPTPWDAHHHSEAKRPSPPNKNTLSKEPQWAATLCAPSQHAGIMGEKKRLNARGEACLHLSHKSTSMYFCGLLWECITTGVDNINTRELFVRNRWRICQTQLIMWACFVYIKTFKLKL